MISHAACAIKVHNCTRQSHTPHTLSAPPAFPPSSPLTALLTKPALHSALFAFVCVAVRVSTKDAPVIWQWSTGHEWIPYDLDTTLSLEAAYQQHQPAVTLKYGFFAANPGYSVTFKRGGGGPGRARHVQTNHNSGMRRQVRRIAEDDAELFRPVSEEERRQAERCSICQLELDEQDDTGDETSSEAVSTTHTEQSGGDVEVVGRAAARQVSGVRKSGSTAVPHSVQTSTSTVVICAATTTAATSTAPPTPIVAASTSSSSSSSSPDRIVRLAHCAPGHGT